MNGTLLIGSLYLCFAAILSTAFNSDIRLRCNQHSSNVFDTD